MRHGWLAVLVVSLGCASAPIKKQDVPALAQADARVLEGCYDCLLEARGGSFDKAKTLVEQTTGDPTLADSVALLKAYLKDK